MTDEAKHVLIIATDFYMIQVADKFDELRVVVEDTIHDGYYLHEIDDGTHRFIPVERIRFFDILTEEKLKENMEEARKQQEAQMRASQGGPGGPGPGGPGGNIIQMPGHPQQ